jgi:hypothetical protein
MSLDPRHEQRLSALQKHIGRAQTITPTLMADVTARACPRFRALASAAKTRVLRQIEAGAFADAALALVALELPGWGARCLVYEDGEWTCSLSGHRELPDWLDDAVEARHETLGLAILTALVEARRRRLSSGQVDSPTVPRGLPATCGTVCCDNFA